MRMALVGVCVLLLSGCASFTAWFTSADSVAAINAMMCEAYAKYEQDDQYKTTYLKFRDAIVQAKGFLQLGSHGVEMAVLLLSSDALKETPAPTIVSFLQSHDMQAARNYLDTVVRMLDPTTCQK